MTEITTKTQHQTTALPTTEPEQYRIEREGARDLSFRGWLLGQGSQGSGGTSGYQSDWNRGTKVDIYLTTGRNLVAAVKQWSCWQGESDHYRAAICKTPAELLAWLEEDAGDKLGRASKKAWEAACAEWDGLEGEDVEEVDASEERG